MFSLFLEVLLIFVIIPYAELRLILGVNDCKIKVESITELCVTALILIAHSLSSGELLTFLFLKFDALPQNQLAEVEVDLSLDSDSAFLGEI